MAVVALTHNGIGLTHGVLLEEGCKDEKWTLAADARIQTEGDIVGVGPVVYKGRTLDEDGDFSSDGTVQQALFMFFDNDGTATYAIIENQSETDVDDTVSDFLTNSGGDISVMKSNKPVVA